MFSATVAAVVVVPCLDRLMKFSGFLTLEVLGMYVFISTVAAHHLGSCSIDHRPLKASIKVLRHNGLRFPFEVLCTNASILLNRRRQRVLGCHAGSFIDRMANNV